jgi:hypothetical protein
MILFPDIDGVLNGHDWNDEARSCSIRRECLAQLNRVIRETPLPVPPVGCGNRSAS